MVSELRCDAIALPLFQLTEERVRLARGHLRSVGYSRHCVELVIGYTEFYSRSHVHRQDNVKTFREPYRGRFFVLFSVDGLKVVIEDDGIDNESQLQV